MVAVLLHGEWPLHATALLVVFAAVAVGAAALAMRSPPAGTTRLLTVTLGTSAQFAVRLSVLVVLAMVWPATELHLDIVLGAFAAGVVIRPLLASVSRREAMVVESKLEGIGFGLLIPIFFVATGERFDLPPCSAARPRWRWCRSGWPGFYWSAGCRSPRSELIGLGLYASTALPLVVVITDVGVVNGWLGRATAAGLVGAAMLSVLAFPLAAQRYHRVVVGAAG